MAVAMKDAIAATVKDPKTSPAFQIARMIRNAFAHAPLSPTWRIDKYCLDRVFEIPDIVTLNTKGLDETPFDWRHYGGPLALFRLCRFVRIEILKDQPPPRKPVPVPANTLYQQGNLILRKVDAIPEGAVLIDPSEIIAFADEAPHRLMVNVRAFSASVKRAK
jgi:hypothetical protein